MDNGRDRMFKYSVLRNLCGTIFGWRKIRHCEPFFDILQITIITIIWVQGGFDWRQTYAGACERDGRDVYIKN